MPEDKVWVNALVERELRDAARDESKATGISVSFIIRRALIKFSQKRLGPDFKEEIKALKAKK